MKTTTIKKKHNLSAVMSRAWEIRRDAAAEMGCKVSEVVFSICLKMAWAEAEGENAAVNAAAIVGEWADMSDEAQVKFMTACVRKAAKNNIKYSVEDKYLQFSEIPAWSLHGHNFDEFVSETWLRVNKTLTVKNLTERNEDRAKKHKRPMTLVSVVYNAARASVEAIAYADSKHAAATSLDIVNDNGAVSSYVETMVADSATGPEEATVAKLTLEKIRDFAAGQDNINKQIIGLMAQRYSERQIASTLSKSSKISNIAVHKRIVKMRKEIRKIAE